MKPRRRMRWSGFAWLAVFITFLGALLRLYRLDAQSFWGDEAITSIIAASGLRDVLGNAYGSANPPAYYLLLHFWRRLAGGSDLALRLPSALMGVLGIPLTYQLGRNIRTRQLGLWAAAITAVAPFHVFYSQEARMYTQLYCLVCILVLAYVRLWQGGRRSWWLVFFLASVGGLYTHFFAGFAVGILGAHFSFRKLWPKWSGSSSLQSVGAVTSPPRWCDYFAVNGAVLVLLSLYLPHFFNQVLKVESAAWRLPPPVNELVGLPPALTVSQFLSGRSHSVTIGLTLFLTIIVGLQIARALWQKAPAVEWVILLSLLSLVPPAVSFIISRVSISVFEARYLTVSVPAFYLLLAWSATDTREATFNQVILIALLTFMGWGLHNWYFDASFAKPPIRDAALLVRRSAKPNVPVIHGVGTSHKLFRHYAPDLDNHVLPDLSPTHGSEEAPVHTQDWMLDSVPVRGSGFWYVLFPVRSLESQIAWRDRFDAQFDRRHEWDVGGIGVYYYANGDV